MSEWCHHDWRIEDPRFEERAMPCPFCRAERAEALRCCEPDATGKHRPDCPRILYQDESEARGQAEAALGEAEREILWWRMTHPGQRSPAPAALSDTEDK